MRRNITLRVRASVPAELGRLRSPAWFRSEFEAACARHVERLREQLRDELDARKQAGGPEETN